MVMLLAGRLIGFNPPSMAWLNTSRRGGKSRPGMVEESLVADKGAARRCIGGTWVVTARRRTQRDKRLSKLTGQG
jgi:hypothetical protein